MSRLTDIVNGATQAAIGTINMVKAVLAINAAAAPTVKTTNALSYVIKGVQYTRALLAAQSIVATHTQHGTVVGGGYNIPPQTTAYFTLGVNPAGVIAVVQGSYAGQPLSNGQMGTSSVGDGFIPDVPDNYAAFGVIKVTNNNTVVSGTNFVPGTTALDAANMAVSYFDIAVIPGLTL